MTHMIKRYNNRKLYYPASSKYVTIIDIFEMIQSGEKVIITDNSTGRDVTDFVLKSNLSKVIMSSEQILNCIKGNNLEVKSV